MVQGNSSSKSTLNSTHDQRLSEVLTALKIAQNGPTSALKLDISSIAQSLYARAPLDFLERSSVTELTSIATHAGEALEKFSQSFSPVLIIPKTTDSASSFYIVMNDRPFIVSSVIEAVRASSLDVTALLHPLFTIDQKRISLCYLELGKLSQSTAQKIQSVLLETLQDVLLLSDSHSTMIKSIERLCETSVIEKRTALYAHSDNQEVHELLRWMIDGSFIFAGTCQWALIDGKISTTPAHTVGLFNSKAAYLTKLISEAHEDAQRLLEINEPLWISRLSIDCPVHRRLRFAHLHLPLISAEGIVTGIFSAIGIFSSKASTEEGSSIPLIKRKMNRLLESEGITLGSHDYKFIIDIVDRMPKEEAIRLNHAGLQDIVNQSIEVFNRNETKLLVRYDASLRGATVLVFLPRERLNEDTRQKLQKHIEQFFRTAPGASEYHLDLSTHRIARFYFHIPITGTLPNTEALIQLENEVKEISQTWADNLTAKIRDLAQSSQSAARYSIYRDAFSPEYQALNDTDSALCDIEAIETLTDDKPMRVMLAHPTEVPGGIVRLDIYRLGSDLTLSQVIPVLENAGFEVISEQSSLVTPLDKPRVYIHRFTVQPRISVTLTIDRFYDCLGPGLEDIFLGQAESDVLTSLMLTAHLNIRCVTLARAYTSLLWQLNVSPRKHLIREALAANPKAALKLWELFEYKFNPARPWSMDERLAHFAKSKAEYEDILREESDITNDRILRSLLKLVEHSKRTNFFNDPEAIAIKLHSEVVDIVPQPRPWFEIFVHSKDIEGTHLRCGPVSRGGLRWSERPDDFRTEVLGLVKTQKVKNVFIVPTGAKGGFVVRTMPKNPELIGETVRNTYRLFIRTLLSIADNRVGDGIATPAGVIAHDALDPYFVVAADKGTATFSDTANSIATDEYGFWLDDAFASGGSNGYDHKLYGITAKGAWECVIRHFNDLGIDFLHEPFTAVGIGDMAGDVFGNGMLLADTMKLIGAFNHKHIFIDPNPDPAASFKERTRLFNLPRSQWSDYDTSLISAGGGIFSRSAKEISITPEMRNALGIPADGPATLTGEELISYILKAPVDLLWNGGIGTYVKSSDESNADVNDSANDRVRVSASELRCKVVGEGGNLGFTQSARIEFASLGGRINTDAIDNSGGVGLSDREVNIKILFAQLIKQGQITRDARNQLLKEMALDVCEEVLEQNREHAYRLSSSSKRSLVQLEYFKGFITHMAKLGFVNRVLDSLPDDDELFSRLKNNHGLYRPELAVCLAASKMWVKSVLLNSKIIKSASLRPLLLAYFPKKLQERYNDAILTHPLADHIIATQATNLIVDSMGISFIFRLSTNASIEPETAIEAALATCLLCDAQRVSRELRKADSPRTNALYIRCKEIFEQSLRDFSGWLIANYKGRVSLDDLVEQYTNDLVMLRSERLIENDLIADLSPYGIDANVLEILRGSQGIAQSLESLWIARQLKITVKEAWNTYEKVKSVLGLSSVAQLIEKIVPQNKWEHSLSKSAASDIRRGIALLTLNLMKRPDYSIDSVEAIMQESPSFKPLLGLIQEMQNISAGVAHIALIAKQMREFTLVAAQE